MKYSVGVEYALHCLLYMVDLPAGQAVPGFLRLKLIRKFPLSTSDLYLSFHCTGRKSLYQILLHQCKENQNWYQTNHHC